MSRLKLGSGCALAVCAMLLWTGGADPPEALAAPKPRLEDRVALLETRLLQTQDALLLAMEQIMDLEEKLACVHTEAGEINGLAGPHLIIEGCNVHVRSETGETSLIDGTGNLIVGHNELDFFGGAERTGSNNLVVGRAHSFTSFGGFVAGEANVVSAPAATVSAGRVNRASGIYAGVHGGSSNTATAESSSILGGASNRADAWLSTVSGGIDNDALGTAAAVSGGTLNEASGESSVVSGGAQNVASELWSTVSGGFQLTADNQVEHLP